MPIGYSAMVLHAHLPFVRHPEYDFFLEEHWLFEAITETYVPIISMYEGLINDGVDFRMTMSLTPPLLSMLIDPLLQSRYLIYLGKLIELSEKELFRTKGDPHFEPLARFYHERFLATYEMFENRFKRNLVNAFKQFQDYGVLEIITCGATHGFLPLLQNVPQAVRAQIEVAANNYKLHLGRQPRGIWLPECGYYPGVDMYLKEAGINFFFTDTHGILHAEPKPRYGAYAPLICPDSGVAVFCRDKESSEQVWSSLIGYPGNPNYREYYRDLGYDMPHEYIKDYVQPDGTRKNTGIKYYKVTGKTDKKLPYNLEAASTTASLHAQDFLIKRQKQIQNLYNIMGRSPVVLSPYDAELYGHWWFEGPKFLNYLLRYADQQDIYKMTTPSEYLANNPVNQLSQPSASSWGANGYNSFWLNTNNDYIYRHLHKAAEKMVEITYLFQQPYDLQKRALNQMARELLLAQSSDWAFIMQTGTMPEYAEKRTKTHISRFNKLYEMLRADLIDDVWLTKVEYIDNIFPEIDYNVYR
jgi:1,4-alpha-glucan branching enzyme